jgi:hypothetical protein
VQVSPIIEALLFSLYEVVSFKMNNETLKNLEFIRTTGSLRGRAKRPRPRRQVKKARRRSLSYVESVFGRQRRHRALQPVAVELVVWIHSTKVENIRQINFFMQNKPNFPHFSLENDDCAKKQTQYKPNSNPIKANFGPKIRVAKPNKPKTKPIASKAIINLSSFMTSKYEKINRWREQKTSPNFIPDVDLLAFLPGDKPNF